MTKAHELADLLPKMSDSEFSDLKESIQRNGLRHPIVMLGSEVLTGRHRMRACQELGMQPQIRQYDPQKDGPLPVEFVLDEEIHRRHMGTDQRAIFAAKLQAYKKAQEEAGKGEEEEADNTVPFSSTESPGDTSLEDPNPGDDDDIDIKTKIPGSGKTANEEDGDGPNTSTISEDDQALMDKFKIGRNKLQQAKKIATADPEIVAQIEKGEMTLDEAELLINRRSGASSYRKEAADLISPDHGDDIAEEIRNCDLLYPDKDLKAFMGVAAKERTDLLKTIKEQKWSARQAIKFHSGAFAGSDSLTELLEWADWEVAKTGKKRATFSFGGKKIIFE